MTSGGIGRITTDGELSGWPSVGGAPSMIVTGPDNALWFTLNQGNAVGRLTPATGSRCANYPLPQGDRWASPRRTMTRCGSPRSSPTSWAAFRWTRPIQEIDLPGKPHAVVADPDDGVWVSLWGANQIARVSGDGEIVTIDLPPGSEPHGLAIGPDGALWVALEAGFVLRMPT